MRVVIAPDSFKGSATAVEVARALSDGWSRSRPQDHVTLLPMADGGEGTVDAVASAMPGAELRRTRVPGPDGREVEARWLMLPDDGESRTALVELAEASGLLLLDAPAPLTAHTLGLGELLVAVLADGAERLLIGLGGSGSTDGGAGALRGLGATLVDERGRPVPLGNAGLHQLMRADLGTAAPLPPGGAFLLSDVDNPLLGSRGAVAVFGPQKGLDQSMAAAAERALERFATAIATSGGRASEGSRAANAALATSPGAGAAGGTGFGLLAWGADIEPGARVIAETIGLPAALIDADLVITGEGRFDAQSAGGKAPVEVARLAAEAGVRCALVAGSIDSASTADFIDAIALDTLAGTAAAAMTDPLFWLRAAAERLADAQTGDAVAGARTDT